MGFRCDGNCTVCGRCANAPILTKFMVKGEDFKPRTGYGIAVDIGTTTLVFALINLEDGKLVGTKSRLNPQREFGPDVISRIEAAGKGKLGSMQNMITDSISQAADELMAAHNIPPADIAEIAIASNTVMTHLLLGLDPKSLGVLPFKPVASLAESYSAWELLPNAGIDCPVKIFPWIAAYVGGDITAGLALILPDGRERFLLIDLGTNGEMALYNRGELIVTATAAGPAFEQTVAASGQGSPAFGSASGVITALAELVREGRLDDTGALEDEEVFTQKQVRDLQLAKSAIRSGLEILLEVAGLTYHEVDMVYLAGGIGQAMVIADALTIGLIPPEMQDKATPAGNACLGGAAAVLANPKGLEYATRLIGSATEINLATHPKFNDYFMEYMYFE